ncbi:hypothetical protein BDN67DRAFT_981196 [Paxillus ammoniavirescens]|nr:hypothetical protein BDN67DRAFT_981196 [Paxillus ammoniavirescens]
MFPVFNTLSGPAAPQVNEDSDAEAEQVAKRRKKFVAKVCREKGLVEDALESFAVMDAVEMVITMHAELLVKKQEEAKNDAHHYIHSEEFKDILKDRLRLCLLSPNLTAYVIDLASNVFAYAKKNLATFKIPAKAIEDPEMLDHIHVLIKEILTSQRSNIKQKHRQQVAHIGPCKIVVTIRILRNHYISLVPFLLFGIISPIKAMLILTETRIISVPPCRGHISEKKVKRRWTRHLAAEAPVEEDEAVGTGMKL